jgi:hypothetical protein
MRRPLPAAVPVLLLAGCAGGALASSYTGASPAPAPDVFTCAREQLKSAGFSQTSYDTDDFRVSGLKYDEEQRRPDVQFRRIVDRLEVDVSPGADGSTEIAVQAKTFAELATHRGPTEEQERASENARSAAQSLLQKCSQPVDSTSVPG